MPVKLFFIPVFFLLLPLATNCSSNQKRTVGVSPVSGEKSASATTSATDNNEDPDQENDIAVSDPFEGYNRKMHGFNDFFLRYCIYPIASGWNFITPKFMRVGLDNFINWAYTPGRLVNNLLQAKFKGAGREVAFFTINATMGALGLYDAAKDVFALERTEEDTDQTLGKWGISEGAYIVWPFIGPRTVRGTFGFGGDVALQPQMVIVPVYIKPETLWAQAAIVAATYSVRAINNASLDPGEYENFIKDAIDPYVFIRDIYLQNTRKKVAD
jgi:phospholipid-binding lipoprotein MlaA